MRSTRARAVGQPAVQGKGERDNPSLPSLFDTWPHCVSGRAPTVPDVTLEKVTGDKSWCSMDDRDSSCVGRCPTAEPRQSLGEGGSVSTLTKPVPSWTGADMIVPCPSVVYELWDECGDFRLAFVTYAERLTAGYDRARAAGLLSPLGDSDCEAAKPAERWGHVEMRGLVEGFFRDGVSSPSAILRLIAAGYPEIEPPKRNTISVWKRRWDDCQR